MSNTLKNKVAIVTGASRGIGAAMAERIRARGGAGNAGKPLVQTSDVVIFQSWTLALLKRGGKTTRAAEPL